MAESEEKLKSLLMRAEEESKKAGLKVNIQKTKFMAAGPITSWQVEGGKVGAVTVTDFLFLGSKITQMVTAAMKLKKQLAPWKESCDKPRQHVKKQRYHFIDKVLCSQKMVFLALM